MKPYVITHLKDMNRRNVYRLIRGMEHTSKAEISRLTGISGPTAVKIVNFFLEQNLVTEIGSGEVVIGRKPHLIALNTDLMYTASFLLEGYFLNCAVVDIQGKVVYKIRMQVKQDFDYIINEIHDVLIDRLFAEARLSIEKLCGVGIALPCIYNKEANSIAGVLVANMGERCIEAESERIAQKYGVEVFIENDTNAQAIGEFERLNLNNTQDLIFISLGMGLGAGVIMGGKLRRGFKNMCGEIGYISYDENYHSTKKEWGWLEEQIGYRHIKEKFGVDIVLDPLEIDSEKEKELVEYISVFLAKCINNITVFLDCEYVVLGGEILGFLGEPLVERVNEYLSHLCVNKIQARMQSTADTGLIGMNSLVMEKKIESLLKEE